MKILSFEEFCKEPDGTVFSCADVLDYGSGQLYRRGEVISYDGGPKDFFVASLFAEQQAPGAAFVVDLTESRWGLFDYDQEFAVYENEDISTIIRGMASDELIALKALTLYGWTVEPTMLYDEEGIDGWRWSHSSGLEYCEIGEHNEIPPLPDGVRKHVLEQRK